jgi:hypothetical protein
LREPDAIEGRHSVVLFSACFSSARHRLIAMPWLRAASIGAPVNDVERSEADPCANA